MAHEDDTEGEEHQRRRLADRITELEEELEVTRRQRDDAELRAITDRMTKLYNYDGLLDHGAKLIARHARQGGHIAVMMVDVVGLKRINDEIGSGFADSAIFHVAEGLRKQTRVEELSGRKGGDEFIVVLLFRKGELQPNMEQILKVARRIRLEVPDYVPGREDARIELRFGIWVTDQTELTMDELMHKSSLGLNVVKRQMPSKPGGLLYGFAPGCNPPAPGA